MTQNRKGSADDGEGCSFFVLALLVVAMLMVGETFDLIDTRLDKMDARLDAIEAVAK